MRIPNPMNSVSRGFMSLNRVLDWILAPYYWLSRMMRRFVP